MSEWTHRAVIVVPLAHIELANSVARALNAEYLANQSSREFVLDLARPQLLRAFTATISMTTTLALNCGLRQVSNCSAACLRRPEHDHLTRNRSRSAQPVHYLYTLTSLHPGKLKQVP